MPFAPIDLPATLGNGGSRAAFSQVGREATAAEMPLHFLLTVTLGRGTKDEGWNPVNAKESLETSAPMALCQLPVCKYFVLVFCFLFSFLHGFFLSFTQGLTLAKQALFLSCARQKKPKLAG